MGSLPSSMKIDFRRQPSEVVLSVIESAQSPFLSRSAMILIHRVIIIVGCSRRLFDVRKHEQGRNADGVQDCRKNNNIYLLVPKLE